MTDNIELDDLLKCTNIDTTEKVKLYIRNIAMALQLGQDVLHVGNPNHVPNDEDIPVIKKLIGEIDSKTLELIKDYLLKAEACTNNLDPNGYSKLTDIRDAACSKVADRVREVRAIIQKA